MVTYTKRLVRGSAFLLIMSVIAAFISYFTRIVLARSLTPEEYGLFYAVFAFISFFLFFRDLGLNQALAKYIPEFKVKQDYKKIKTAIASVFLWQLISSSVFGVILFIFSDFLAENYFKNPSAAWILKVFLIYILFSMVVLLLRSIFQGFQKIKLFSIIEALKNLLMLLFTLLFLKAGLRIFAPVYAFALSWMILSIVLVPFFIKTFNIFKYKSRNFGKITKTMFRFGIPVLLTAIGAKVIARIDTLMLTYFTTLDQVGIYNVVLPTALVFLFFGDSIATVVFPMISELWAKKDIKKLREWLRMLYKYSFVITTPILLAVFAFSDLFIKIFFGDAYVGGARALQILLIGILFFILAKLNNSTLTGIGKPVTVTKIILFVALVNFIANWVLIPKLGIEGAAFATTFSYLVVLVLSVYNSARFIKVKIPLASWIKTIIASLLFVFVIYIIKGMLIANTWLELIISVSMATIVYVGLAYILKLVDIEEIKKYVKLVR